MLKKLISGITPFVDHCYCVLFHFCRFINWLPLFYLHLSFTNFSRVAG